MGKIGYAELYQRNCMQNYLMEMRLVLLRLKVIACSHKQQETNASDAFSLASVNQPEGVMVLSHTNKPNL